MRQASSVHAERRRGAVLLVVMAMLTLFAVLGLSFVLYANATAEGSRLHREAQSESRPNVDPELLFSYFLGQMLYDVPDDANGVYSAMRGHSLARSMFGADYTGNSVYTDSRGAPINITPYNGTGRLRVSLKLPGLPTDLNDYHLVNYTYFPGDDFIRDPERPGLRPGTGPDPLAYPLRARFLGGFNAPYTYPDLNNMFLAAVKADGSVMLPSFHRPWVDPSNPLKFFGSLDPQNPNWRLGGPQGNLFRHLVMRPRPVDMGPGFPYPEDAGGDVKNLIGYPGTLIPGTGVDGVPPRYANNDSIWLDLDAPIIVAPDGRKFKPLFAPLIMDLDNRVNLNVHGNARGQMPLGRFHASNQGWGPWEVNPGHLGGPIEPGTPLTRWQQEWANMVTGSIAPRVEQRGRLGFDPPSGGITLPGQMGRIYSPVDFDGGDEVSRQLSGETRLPGIPPSLPWQCFPNVPSGYGNGSPAELLNHPMRANPYVSTINPRTSEIDTYVFPLSNIEALLRYGDTGSPALTSELFRLAPLNFGDFSSPLRAAESLRRRNLVTVHSCDVDRPGVMPFFWTSLAGLTPHHRNQMLGEPPYAIPPSGPHIPFRLPLSQANPLFDPDSPLFESEFGRDYRAKQSLTRLRRLDLNRYLPKYPEPDPSSGTIGSDVVGATIALRARQYMAAEIFERLCLVTGAGSPATVPMPVPAYEQNRWEAFRWLAQLAVNIVDFIDPDDNITPFQWDARIASDPPIEEWVYGTELPRLVINEAYIQHDNGAVSTWVELHNPLATDRTLANGGAALLHNGNFPIYQLIISRGPELGLRLDPTNVRGNPQNALTQLVPALGPPGAVVLPATGDRYASRQGAQLGQLGGNKGFYVVGPDPTLLPVTYTTGYMTYPSTTSLLPHTLLLRRLACPQLRPNSPDLPGYNINEPLNPYVTVDYLDNVSVNESSTAMDERFSIGRKQPFAATQKSRQMPTPIPGNPLPAPRNSFFQHNVDAQTPGPNWPGILPQNDPGYPAFDWLVHLDRPLISPMELLNVSAYKPHLLTQMFVTGPTDNLKFTHRAPWFDQGMPLDRSHRLYRAFEFFTTGNLANGMGQALAPGGGPLLAESPVTIIGQDVQMKLSSLFGPTASGGTWQIEAGSTLIVDQGGPREEVVRVKRVLANQTIGAEFLRMHPAGCTVAPTILSDRIPGKINLNTVWDLETFLALCDPQPANEFTLREIEEMFDKLIRVRTLSGVPAENDKPFLGMGVGNSADSGHLLAHPHGNGALFPGGSGLNETFFRSKVDRGDASTPRLFHATNPIHPYLQNQLLHKFFNQVTPRSNVFAVWVTVGFFEVVDDTSRPVKLGAELGRAEGKHIRHRMFAVVDRSVMWANPGPQPGFRLHANSTNAWTTGLVVPYYSIIE